MATSSSIRLPHSGQALDPRAVHGATRDMRDGTSRSRALCCFDPHGLSWADELVASADLALAYGGQDIVDKYRHHPQVRVQGPGRAKILIGADVCMEEAVSLVATSMTDLGGAACVSASAVMVEGM